MTSQPSLDRRLGTLDAVTIGLGSMIGAGVFAVFAPAARIAGAGLLLGLVIAAGVAYCNATSSAQLAAQYPESGGTYLYGRARLGPWWGFAAGWSFLVGKTASCTAMALTFAAYVAPPAWQRPVAVAAVAALVAINYRGVTRTALATKIIVAFVLLSLAVLVGAGWFFGGADPTRVGIGGLWAAGPYAIAQSAGLLFFAFAGYARIATLGEEVVDPSRTIPRSIAISLAVVVMVYAVVAVTALATLGPAETARTSAPLAAAAETSGSAWLPTIVRFGGAAAALSALLALIAGISRTALAMARERDLPHWLAGVHPRYRVPHHAELALGAVVCAVVLVVDLREAIGFSSFGVLTYYLVANLSALTQQRADRRYPRILAVIGALGCAGLALTLPLASVGGGVAVLAIGILLRVLVRRAI